MALQSYICIWVHYIWATKKRNPLITPALKMPLYNQIRAIAAEKNYHLNYINGVEDHVHVLMSLNSTTPICEIPKMLKGASSKWVNDNQLINDYFEWQDGYAAFSVSPSNLLKVRNYIKNQEKHHKGFTFEDEISKLESQAKEFIET